jgi:Bacterial Ig-like domain
LASSSTDNTVTYDITRPTVTINQASAQVDPTKDTPIAFTTTFSEVVTGFTASDVVLTGTAGATTTVVTGGPSVYTISVSGMTGDGTVIASIPAGGVQDGAANTNIASASTDNTVTYDGSRPSAVIVPAAVTEPTQVSPVTFSVSFSEAVTGFDATDIDLSASTAFGSATPVTVVTGGPTVYTVKVYGMTTDGTIAVSVAPNKTSDSVGNLNTAATGDGVVDYDFVPDTTKPDVVVALDPTQDAVAQDGPAKFTVTFSEPVTGFTIDDLVVTYPSAGSPLSARAISDPTIAGSGTSYTVTVPVSVTAEGAFTLGVTDGAAKDLAGNVSNPGNTASVTIDRTAPAVTVSLPAGSSSETSSSPVMLTVTFSEPVTGFESNDVVVSGTANPTTASVTGSGATYEIAVTGMTQSGTVVATIPAGAAKDKSGRASSAFSTRSSLVSFAISDLAKSKFVPLNPVRLFDSRPNGDLGPKGLVGAGEQVDIVVAGLKGVPADAVAVVINLTATESRGAGFVTAWPTGETRPTTSNVNLTKVGQTRANEVTIKVGAGGKISLFTTVGTHLLADTTGYFVTSSGPTSAGRFVALPPKRAFDTRSNPEPGPKGFVKADKSISVQIGGVAGVPAAGVSAVVMSVIADDSAGSGFVTIWPSGIDRPVASSINLNGTGETAPNLVIVPLGADGKLNLYTFAGAHLIGDVLGYFTDATATASESGLFVPTSPNRLFDTRPNSSPGPKGYVPADSAIEVQVAGQANMPSSGVGAVMLNVTALDAKGPGYVTVWPSGERPNVSTLNLSGPGDTRANSSIMSITAPTNRYYAFAGAHMLADTFGWFTV